ncbi:MAG: hypothetical protein DLM57_04255 [Pseudonocardiales bacterium]|nr:MAG: hypothetical protein DLM57_04255 [Pseudonocardiales bacterium]
MLGDRRGGTGIDGALGRAAVDAGLGVLDREPPEPETVPDGCVLGVLSVALHAATSVTAMTAQHAPNVADALDPLPSHVDLVISDSLLIVLSVSPR